MLTVTIFLPLAVGLVILLLPGRAARAIRGVALAGAAATFALSIGLWLGYDPAAGGLQWRHQRAWIPQIGASYDVAVDGVSLPLVVLAALMLLAVSVYVLGKHDRTKAHAFLFLLMTTGLLGVFAAQDLLLFYLFFEVALVPMYFVVGVWGHEDRRYAAIKFFLYTRAGSLAMLLGILGLYLAMEPHTFSLPEIAAATPLSGAPVAGGLVLLGLLLGFGVKLPTVPLHNWLPDAHVEAPTEGSVMLAAVQLKMGAYGLVRILLPTVPEAAARWGWVLAALGLASLIYGALAALSQKDFKRLVAYTSVSHMGYVLLAVGVTALLFDPSVRALALTGATYQMVSHGLLTGGMFFMVGMLQDQAGTRDLPRFGGLMTRTPVYAFVLALLAFGSLGLPGFSGFVAELQVIGATVSLHPWAAAAVVVGLVITTAVYLRVVTGLILGEAPKNMPDLAEPGPRALSVVGALAALSLLLGVLPAFVVQVVESTTRVLGAQ